MAHETSSPPESNYDAFAANGYFKSHGDSGMLLRLVVWHVGTWVTNALTA